MPEARRVLYAKERHQRATKTVIGRAWGILQDITIGYGYQPWRAALWFALLLAAGSAIFAVGSTPPHTSGAAMQPRRLARQPGLVGLWRVEAGRRGWVQAGRAWVSGRSTGHLFAARLCAAIGAAAGLAIGWPPMPRSPRSSAASPWPYCSATPCRGYAPAWA
jgi:hypothetical protein